MESSYIIGSIIVATLATYATRIIPFLLFRTREPSPLIKYIELNMPLMIMVILVFYALKDVKWESYPYDGYRDWETDRKSTRLNSSHITRSRMPSSA